MLEAQRVYDSPLKIIIFMHAQYTRVHSHESYKKALQGGIKTYGFVTAGFSLELNRLRQESEPENFVHLEVQGCFKLFSQNFSIKHLSIRTNLWYDMKHYDDNFRRINLLNFSLRNKSTRKLFFFGEE